MDSQGKVAAECDQVTSQLVERLLAAGLHVTRSFDLQSARQALRDPAGCPCPHHGTAECTCQYMVLLVDDGAGLPLTIVAHGHDQETHLSIYGLEMSAGRTGAIVREAVERLAVPAPTSP